MSSTGEEPAKQPEVEASSGGEKKKGPLNAAALKKIALAYAKDLNQAKPIEIKDEMVLDMRYGVQFERVAVAETINGFYFNARRGNMAAAFANTITLPDKCVCKCTPLDNKIPVDFRKRFLAKGAQLQFFLGRIAPDKKEVRLPTMFKIYAMFLTQTKLYVMTDSIVGWTTVTARNNKRNLTQAHAQKVMKQVAESVKWLHENGIAHLNVRGEAFLVDDKGNVKMDGLTRLFQFINVENEKIEKHEKVLYPNSIWNQHLPPECFKAPFDPCLADIFSYGIMLYRTFTNEKAFYPRTVSTRGTEALPKMYEQEIKKKKKPIPDMIKTVLPKMIAVAKPAERMNWDDIMKADFLAGVVADAAAPAAPPEEGSAKTPEASAKEPAKEEPILEGKEGEAKEEAKEDAKEGEAKEEAKEE